MLPIYASELFGERAFNKVVGIFVAVFQTGSALSSPAMNLCFDLTGSYKPAFIVIGIMMTMMLIMIHIAITSATHLRLKTGNIVLNKE